MHIPAKHHFLPAFYLKRWAFGTATHEVIAYTRPRGALIQRSYAPGAIGYEHNLYSVASRADPHARQAVETDFMGPLDNDAACALAYMESAHQMPDDPHMRDGWSRFLMSLLFRSPDRIRWLRAKAEGRHDLLADNYARLRRPSDPLYWQDYKTAQGSALNDEVVASLLCSFSNNSTIGEILNGMFWFYVRYENLAHSLLTSDNPIIVSNGIGKEDGFVLLPIGPAAVFVATNTARMAKIFEARPKLFALALNDAIVRQADKLVIGSTRSQATFVDRRLGNGGPSSTEGWLERLSWTVQ